MPWTELIAAMPASPRRGWTAGEPRRTPKGHAIEGHYRESYCCCDLGGGDDGELALLISRSLDLLEKLHEVLRDLRARGASFAFFVSWNPDGDSGETFDVELLRRMSNLGIALGLNVVP